MTCQTLLRFDGVTDPGDTPVGSATRRLELDAVNMTHASACVSRDYLSSTSGSGSKVS